MPNQASEHLEMSADRAADFAAAAYARMADALLRCEERYPNDGSHSVLWVVVEKDAAQWRSELEPLHEQYFGNGLEDPLSPVRLEVVDVTTDQTLQRLVEAGLVARTIRASRALWPVEERKENQKPLSSAEMEKSAGHRARAQRKLRIAQVLNQAGLGDEARSALLEAVAPLGCALAVENRLPEPETVYEALLPPLASAWRQALPLLRNFACNSEHPFQPVLDALNPLVQEGQPNPNFA